jgi:hypothetical protein
VQAARERQMARFAGLTDSQPRVSRQSPLLGTPPPAAVLRTGERVQINVYKRLQMDEGLFDNLCVHALPVYLFHPYLYVL